MQVEVRRGEAGSQPLRVVLSRHNDFTVFYEIFVEGVYDELLERVRPGDVVVDAGANIGLFTLLASRRVGRDGHVISLEPEPENLERLRTHVVQNDLTNVTVVPRAVDARSGEVRMMLGSGIRARLSDLGGTSVLTTSLDDAVAGIGLDATILKMDIEGSESSACDGMSKVLASVRALAIEIHDSTSESRVKQLLNAFDVRPVKPRRLSSYLRYGASHPLFLSSLEAANGFHSLRGLLFSRAGRLENLSDGGYPVDWIADRRGTPQKA